MKKIILILAIVFTTSTFGLTTKTEENLFNKKEKVEVIYKFNKKLKMCEIKIKGTYDGKKIDVTVTVQAKNCAAAAGALLKEYTK